MDHYSKLIKASLRKCQEVEFIPDNEEKDYLQPLTSGYIQQWKKNNLTLETVMT